MVLLVYRSEEIASRPNLQAIANLTADPHRTARAR